MRSLLLLALVALAGCGDAIEDNHFANDIREERPVSAPVETTAVPVRVGELGPNFPACNAAGVTRNLNAGATLAVRAAPFDTAEETGRVASGNRFFVCARSHDQKWLGIVFDPGGAPQTCGLSTPIASGRAYEGACSSGWVSSAFVKLAARIDPPARSGAEQAESSTGQATEFAQ